MRLDGPEGAGRDVPEEQPLGAVLARRRLAASEIARIGSQVANSLARGHAQGDPHRAVSPDCIMIDRTGRARLVAPDARPVATAYLSPEQVRGEPVGGPADVYALGLVLLEAATGHQVFPGNTPAAAEARLYHQPIVPNYVPGPLARALLAMTETLPDARPSAARAGDMLAGAPSAGAPAGQPVAGPGYARIAAIGLPVLVLLVILGLVLFNNRDHGATGATPGTASSAHPTATASGPTPGDSAASGGARARPTSSARASSTTRPGLPGISLPRASDLPKIEAPKVEAPKVEAPKLPELTGSGSVKERLTRAWSSFTAWLSRLL